MSEIFPCFEHQTDIFDKEKHIFISKTNKLLFSPVNKSFLFNSNYGFQEGYKIFDQGKDAIFLHIIDEHPIENLIFIRQKEIFPYLDSSYLNIYSRSIQLAKWISNFTFCPKHGNELSVVKSDLAKSCIDCRFDHYPKMSPCILVVVKNGSDILLVKHNNGSQFYTAIAGFVEYGETIEGTVKREVFEEVGIEISNLKYFNSQSWPFPNQLMMAFTAETKQRALKIDQKEILEADWFNSSMLPQVPPKISLSGQLIREALNS